MIDWIRRLFQRKQWAGDSARSESGTRELLESGDPHTAVNPTGSFNASIPPRALPPLTRTDLETSSTVAGGRLHITYPILASEEIAPLQAEIAALVAEPGAFNTDDFQRIVEDRRFDNRELPFVVGVLADLVGNDPQFETEHFRDRQFINIDRDNFDEVMRQMGPGVSLRVRNLLSDEGENFNVRLKFESFDDFQPSRIVRQVEPLQRLLDSTAGDEDAQRLSQQLSAILHAPEILKLEGTWRGIRMLVFESETGDTLKIRVLNVDKGSLSRDLANAPKFDQSQLFKKVYEAEFGRPESEPYGLLVGDYEFTNASDDVDMLTNISSVAAASFCPFISAAAPQMFGSESYTELNESIDIAEIFNTTDYAKWQAYREREDSSFVALAMPRVLSRLPYGAKTVPVKEFAFEEFEQNVDGVLKEIPHDQFCWTNAAYHMACNMTAAFSKFGICTSIQGVENGGKREGLPAYSYQTPEGDLVMKCPTELDIAGRRESEISNQGFLVVSHHKGEKYAVFLSAQTTCRPPMFDKPEVAADFAVKARLPYLMAVSRFIHYIKLIGRDRLGYFYYKSDIEIYLNRWITQYTTGHGDVTHDQKVSYPLQQAWVQVREVPGEPGRYNAIVRAYPWLPLGQELTQKNRLIARIPSLSAQLR